MRLNSAAIYDAVMRLPIVLFNGFWLGWELNGLRSLVGTHPYLGDDWRFGIAVVARVVLILFLFFLAAFHLTRRRPIKKFQSWRPKIDAVLGLSIGYFSLLLTRPSSSPLWDSLAIALMLGGNFFCLLAVLDLGRSLSIMPEARRLVRSGIYRVVRHPLYLGETVAFFGVFLIIRSWPALAIMLAQLFFQLRRIHWEEAILCEAFPEYAAYRQVSWRLIPKVY